MSLPAWCREWAVLGDPQITRGYCLLLPDPVVPDLNALVGDARRQFLDDGRAKLFPQ